MNPYDPGDADDPPRSLDPTELMARLAAAYLALQAGVGAGLWVAYAASSTVRDGFELLPSHHAVTQAFVLADLLVGVAGSAVGAWALATDRDLAVPATAFTFGGLAYPTLYLVAWQASTRTGGAALAIMLLPTLLTGWIAVWTWRTWRTRRARHA